MKKTMLLLAIICVVSCKSNTPKKDQITSNTITEKYWKLKTLYGKEIKTKEREKRESFITLKVKDNRFTAFVGCNTINGEYVLGEGNKIVFKNIISTRMFCSNSNEPEFLKILNLTNNYTIKEGILSLNVGKRAPLATFKATHLK